MYLCNQSLTEGLFPMELTLANVIPLYKSDDSFVFNYYRPVSLLCVISKVFEKKKLCIIDFLNFSKHTKSLLILSLDSENYIQLVWL